MSETIKIASIDDTGRLRPVDKDHAALIAASIEQGRLEQPIIVRPTGDAFYKLTEGAHRLYAVRDVLGWKELIVGDHVIIREQDDLSARISEIDENLARHELNALDRALFLAERRKLYDEQNRVFGHGGNRKDSEFKEESKSQSLRLGFSPRFTQEVADKVRLSERTIQLALRIAAKIDRRAAADIRGTLIETNQNELLLFVDQPPDEQRKAAQVLKAGDARTTQQARIKLGLEKPTAGADGQEAVYAKLVSLIEKATPVTKAKIADLLWPLLDGKARKRIFDKYESH